MEDKALGLLGLMRRAGAIAIGMDNTADAVRAGKARLVLLSTDAAENARRKAETLTNGRSAQTVVLPYTREELAACLGVSGCAAAAVTDLGFANALIKRLRELDCETYGAAAAEVARRFDKAERRRVEKPGERNKRNGKRRTNV